MGTALVSMGIGLAYVWLMTILDWNYLARRRTRYGWPRSDLSWQLPLLLAMTAVFGLFSWRYFTR